MKNCNSCKCWNRVDGDRGECRKNPPQTFLIPGAPRGHIQMGQGQATITIQALWPPVQAAEWCGAHEPDITIQ